MGSDLCVGKDHAPQRRIRAQLTERLVIQVAVMGRELGEVTELSERLGADVENEAFCRVTAEGVCAVDPSQFQVFHMMSGGGFDVGIACGSVADVETPERARSECRQQLRRPTGNVFGDREGKVDVRIDHRVSSRVHAKGGTGRPEFHNGDSIEKSVSGEFDGALRRLRLCGIHTTQSSISLLTVSIQFLTSRFLPLYVLC